MYSFLNKARSLAADALDLFSGEDNRCQHHGGGNFCPSCGKQLKAAPLDWHTLLEDFTAVWLRRGFRNTVIGLFVRPHKHIATYLRSDRNFLFRPVLYLTTTALFFVWASSITGRLAGCEPGAETACHVLEQYPAFFQMFQALVMAFIIKFVVARRTGWSLGEIVVVMVYLLSQGFLITGAFDLANWASGADLPLWIAALARNAYHYVALAMFLGYRRVGDLLRLLGGMLLSVLLVLAAVAVAGVLAASPGLPG